MRQSVLRRPCLPGGLRRTSFAHRLAEQVQRTGTTEVDNGPVPNPSRFPSSLPHEAKIAKREAVVDLCRFGRGAVTSRTHTETGFARAKLRKAHTSGSDDRSWGVRGRSRCSKFRSNKLIISVIPLRWPLAPSTKLETILVAVLVAILVAVLAFAASFSVYPHDGRRS